jgi:hypothetical protein
MKITKQQKRALASLQAELAEVRDQMKDLDAEIARLSALQVEVADEVKDEDSDEITDSDESSDSDELTDEDIAQLSPEKFDAMTHMPAMQKWRNNMDRAAVARVRAHIAADAEAAKKKSGVLQGIALAGITLGGLFGTALAVGNDKNKKKAR